MSEYKYKLIIDELMNTDALDKLTAMNLIDFYDSIRNDGDYEATDALRKTIKLYLTPTEYIQFLEEHNLL